MVKQIKGTSSSPFYDAAFVADSRARSAIGRKEARRNGKKKAMPITTRTIERWVCDRCGHRAEFPDDHGRTALEMGWLKLDLTRSLQSAPEHYLFERNEQILCPADVDDLARWFEATRDG